MVGRKKNVRQVSVGNKAGCKTSEERKQGQKIEFEKEIRNRRKERRGG
jgi:hypothetical protein